MKSRLLIIISTLLIMGCLYACGGSSGSGGGGNGGGDGDITYSMKFPGATAVTDIDPNRFYDLPKDGQVLLSWTLPDNMSNWSLFIDTITDNGSRATFDLDIENDRGITVGGKDISTGRCAGNDSYLMQAHSSNIHDFTTNHLSLGVTGYYETSGTSSYYLNSNHVLDIATIDPGNPSTDFWQEYFYNDTSRKVSIRIRYCPEKCSEYPGAVQDPNRTGTNTGWGSWSLKTEGCVMFQYNFNIPDYQ